MQPGTVQATQAWLDTIHATDRLDREQSNALLSLLGDEGLKALIALMMGARQGLYVALSNQPLGTEDGRHRASVIQGQIAGIDLLPQTLLELVIPAQPGTEGAKDNHG